MQAVLLEAGGEAGARSGCDASFHTVEALAEELVGVGPDIVPWLIVNVAALTLIGAFVYDIADNWVLHRDAGKFTDVGSGGLVVLVREAVGVREIC